MNNSFIENIVNEASGQGIDFLLVDGKLKLKVLREKPVDDWLLQVIKDNREAIKVFLKEHWEQVPAAKRFNKIKAVEREAVQHIPLSFSQERLWFIDKLQGSVAYHLSWVFRLRGPVNRQALEAACRDMLRRHEILRTVIKEEDGIGYQVITNAEGWQLDYHEQQQQSISEQINYVSSFISRPFDLSKDAMMRMALVKLSAEEHRLVAVIHHIAADAWSVEILLKELAANYNSRLEGQTPVANELAIQYADYAAWQKNNYPEEKQDELIQYWQNQLAGLEPLRLPTDHQRPAILGIRGGIVKRNLSRETLEGLQQFARKQEVTLFTLLLAAFKVLLHRYSGQRDICVGTPVAGRNLREVESLVGFFVNTLAIRSGIGASVQFDELLQQVKSTTLNAYDHEFSFEKVVELLHAERNMSHTPVFQVLFSVREENEAATLSLKGLQIEKEEVPQAAAFFELDMQVIVSAQGLQLTLTYSKDLYKADTIERMLGHFDNLLQEILLNAGRAVETFNLLVAKEEFQLLTSFNETKIAYPADKTILHFIEEMCSDQPNKDALVFGDEKLTYKELHDHSNRLAGMLHKKGITADTLVPVCIDRSVWMVVAMIGIMKAGGAYVPIDTAYPAERIEFILGDINAGIVVTTSALRGLFSARDCIVIDDVQLHENVVAPPLPNGGNLAYAMFTSGSTGKPKGVLIEHASLLNFQLSMKRQLGADDSMRMLAVTTYTFDIAGLELYLPLLSGGTVCIANREQAADGWKLQELIAQLRPTHMQATPATWQMLVDIGWRNQEQVTILTGGEALSPALKTALVEISANTTAWNLYGPTETTIWSTIKALSKEEAVSIGRPIANTSIYILNDALRLCPIGVYGDLYIGGDGLAREYLHQPQLTRERFIKDPFNKSRRAYKTGDVARWLPDGNIEFSTRSDDQLKIRGYRIEPAEIEAVLQQAPGIKQAIVTGRTDAQGITQLVAFVISQGQFNANAVREYLKQHLPEYMVPGLYSCIEQFPLTANGKINRKALAAIDIVQGNTATYTAPRNSTEEALAEIWKQLLGIERPGVHDNFYLIGGHSLLAVRVVAAIHKQFGKALPVRTIFTCPTIAEVAVVLDECTEGNALPDMTRYERPAQIPLSYPQEQLWFIDKLHGSVQYHMPWIFKLKGNVNIYLLEDCFRQIILRHEVLRTVIKEQDGHGYQQVLQEFEWNMEMGERAAGYIPGFIARPFDLSKDVMLRVSLVKLADDEYTLVIVLHHIAGDAWSVGVMTEELMSLYNGSAQGRTPVLTALPVQYADFAIWQRTYLTEEYLSPKIKFWTDRLAGSERTELPSDFKRTGLQRARGSMTSVLVNNELKTALEKLSEEEGVTLFMTLLAAWKVLLYRYTGQQDILVGAPVAGRQLQNAGMLAGCFLNTMVLRSRINGHAPFKKILQQVKEVTLSAQEHQEVPFEKIVEALGYERAIGRNPLFDVKFQLLNMLHAIKLELDGLQCSPQPYTNVQPQLDFSLDILQLPDGLSVSATWNSGLYKASTVERILGHYQNLLLAIIENRDTAVAQLQMLREEEVFCLLDTFNSNELVYEPGQTLLDLFSKQVAARPHAAAVVYENEKLTFRQLDERSNQLGWYLRNKGIAEDSLVAICIERGIEMIVAIMGVLKAGAAYVPIDPAYPAERIAYILKDSKSPLLITSHRHAIPTESTEIIYLDDIDAALSLLPVTAVANELKDHHLAYVVYTSGSTGNPKGVMITHRSVLNLVYNQIRPLNAEPGMAVLQFSSFGFDASCHEIFCTLMHGGVLIMCDKETIMDAAALMNVMKAHEVSLVTLPPSYLAAVKSAGLPVKTIISAGEALNRELAEMIQEQGIRLINAYGPTENTVSSILTDAPVHDDGQIVIGKPNANVKVFIFDKYRQVVPLGVTGDIYLGGVQLARGYLNRPELTAEKFIYHALPGQQPQRLYNTGDTARWLADGSVEFVGRNDEQVKIRGFRVELGEVEAVLQKAPGVQQGVVICTEDEKGYKQLAAYLVAEEVFDKTVVIAHLRSYLPDYMVPGIIVQIAEIPVTPNGKVDRQLLAGMKNNIGDDASITAPRNGMEQDIAQVWSELLGVENPGIDDNFFELGGDSIITIQLVSRLRMLHHELQVGDVFDSQTIRKLAVLIDSRGAAQLQPAAQEQLTGPCGLLPIQQWYFEQWPAVPSHYNQAMLVKIEKNVDAGLLASAVKKLFYYHDSLRFAYKKTTGAWEQVYGTNEGALIIDELSEHIEAQIASYQTALDIASGDLARFVLFKTPAQETHDRLLIIVHHLAIDGISWRILFDDLEMFLRQPDYSYRKTGSVRDWHESLVQYGQSKHLLAQLDHWRGIVKHDHKIPVDIDYNGKLLQSDKAVIITQPGASLTKLLLQEAPIAYHATVNDILLAAFAQTVCEWIGHDTIVIGCEGHGREAAVAGVDVSHTLGWFTNLYPVLLTGIHADSASLIKNTKEQLRAIPANGIGYGVLKYINKEAHLQGTDPWEIVFNYLGQAGTNPLFTIAPENTGASIDPNMPLLNKLEVNSIVMDGELTIEWGYSTRHYEKETIDHLAAQYIINLQRLITHCIQQKGAFTYTPSDLGLAGIATVEELDRFLQQPGKAAIERIYPLSALQQGLLFDSLYDRTQGAYIGQTTCDIKGLSAAIFWESWGMLMERHTILRTAFYHDAFSMPVQCVSRNVNMSFQMIDMRHLETLDHAPAVKSFMAADLQKGFDFTCAPLMRITLFRLGDDHYRMLWTHHHLIFDGWSGPQLLKELLEIYDSIAAGGSLPSYTEDRYEEYIRYAENKDKQQTAFFWQQYFNGLQNATLLPFIPAAVERTRGVEPYAEVLLELEESITTALRSYSRRHHLTINTIMQGAWACLLAKYTGNYDIVFGVTVSGRPDDLSNVEQRVGIYINTLPLYTVVPQDQPVTAWLQSIQQSQQQCRENQYVSLNTIKESIQWKGELFDTMMVFQNYPVDKQLTAQANNLIIDNLEIYEQTNNFPLSVRITADDKLTVQFIYKASILDRVYVENIRGHFENVLLQLINKEAALPENIKIITAREKQQLKAFSGIKQSYPTGISITDVFAAQVNNSPAAVAVVYENESLTYQQLHEYSDQFAHYLISVGVERGALVPVCINRSIDMIVAMLSILKAGAAYVPIDPSYPEDRIEYMLKDTGAPVVVSSTAHSDKIHAIAQCMVIEMDGCRALIEQQPAVEIPVIVHENDLAYVIYTSGSTGLPKGVMIEHKGMINLVHNQVQPLQLKQGISVFQFASSSFDASCHEIFCTLLHGGKLILSPQDTILDAAKLSAVLRKHKVNLVTLPPSYQHIIVAEAFPGLQTIISAGEKLNKELALQIQRKGITLVNAYGPTENTVSSILTNDPITENGMVVIGKPLVNVQAYILDDSLQLLPLGVTGELFLGGAQLARGYLHKPELTTEKFIQLEVDGQATRLYRTGDLSCWLPDGNIQFIGRKDDQVKVRGYRVEPGEIEHVLQTAPGVTQACVIVHEEGSTASLAACVVTTGELDKIAILHYLRSKLPEYFIPAVLVKVDAIPLTPSNKTDKKKLKELISLSLDAVDTYAAPRTPLQQQLAAIWQEILELDRIGISDDFFEAGGHSIAAIRMVAAIRKETELEIGIKDVFDYPTIASLTEFIEGLEPAFEAPKLFATERPARIPLSYAQERLWFIDKLQGSTQYHMPWIFRLDGELNVEVLERSLRGIVQRHEVLRSVIREEEGIGYQLINDSAGWKLETNVRDTISGLVSMPFDLANDYMLRAWLMELPDGAHVLVIVVHHIAFDGWSAGILTSELKELYSSHEQNRQPALKPLPVQYADYAVWQRTHLAGDELASGLSYWQAQLAGIEVLELPHDYPRPAEQGSNGGMVQEIVSDDIKQKLKEICRDKDVTLFMLLLSVCKVLLYRYSGQTDICVGAPIAGRQQTEVEALIGFFVNTLALRSQVNGSMRFDQLLQQVKSTTLEAYDHQEVPFEKVVEALGIARDMSRAPVFQVMFALQSMLKAEVKNVQGLTLSEEPLPFITSKFDLIIDVLETSEGLQLGFIYNADLFTQATAQRLLVHFVNLLRSVVDDTAAPVAQLAMTTEVEKQQLLHDFNSTALTNPDNKNIIDLFSEQVLRKPEFVAVQFGTEQLTYRELDERSWQMAHCLLNAGVKKQSLVLVCLDRSLEMITSILGILKAGCGYVPVDPAYPVNRIKYMVEDAAATAVITQSQNTQLFSSYEQINIFIETDKLNNDQPTTPVGVTLHGNDICYVIFTSGSTGRPKGVAIEHNSLAASTLARCNAYGEVGNTFLVPSFSFDSSVAVIFGTLAMGGTLTLCREAQMKVVDSIREVLASVNTILCVPSYYRFLLAEDLMLHSALSKVILAGEKLEASLTKKHFALNKDILLYNEYGPTESTVWATIAQINSTDDVVTIGKPAPHVRVYILDRDMQPVPLQVPGEIYIGGEGVAREYLHNPALTAEKFMHDPFNEQPSARMYKTGDQARWLPGGNIEYLGRIDDQLKIRGYRIEPGEIEQVLLSCHGVKEASVVAVEDDNNHKHLVGYITSDGSLQINSIENYLRQELPAYMIPQLVVIPEMPLTANGKTDRKKLAAAGLPGTNNTSGYTAPRNEREANLVTIWKELLNVEQISVHDNFFELGGDSIITIQVVSRAKRFGYSLTTRDLFMHQTIAALALLLDNRSESPSNAEQGVLKGECGLLPVQQWFFEQGPVALSHYNQSVSLGIRRDVTVEVLQKAFAALVTQHDALRFSYRLGNNGWVQSYGSFKPNIAVTDLSRCNENELKDELDKSAYIFQQSLDIEEGILIRPVLFITPSTEEHNRLLVIVHHLAIDGVSWRILLEDLEACITGVQNELPLKTSSYRQWHTALVAYGKSQRLQAQKKYWEATTGQHFSLPVDTHCEDVLRRQDMNDLVVKLDAASTRSLLQQLPLIYHTEITDVLLAALAHSLHAWCGSEEILIALEGHGREHVADAVDVSRTVGWFTSLFPVLLRMEDPTEIGLFVRHIKEQLRAIPDKGLGYGVLKYINKEPLFTNERLPQLLFNYLGQADNVSNNSRWFAPVEAFGEGTEADKRMKQQHLLEINCIVTGGELVTKIEYSTKHYQPATIEKFASDYIDALQQIINSCATATPQFTPSDLGLAGKLSIAELDDFLDDTIERVYPLSALQEGILFHSWYAEGSSTYIMELECELQNVNISAFNKSWEQLMRRHSILRTGFYNDRFSVPVQAVHKSAKLPVEMLDLSNLSQNEQQTAFAEHVQKAKLTGFNFEQAPLMKVILARLSAEKYKMLFLHHHLILDGWSLAVLMKEFLEAYETIASGHALAASNEDQYEDYIRYLSARDKEREQNYWSQYLQGMEAGTQLPFIGRTAEWNKGLGILKEEVLQLDENTAAQLEIFAQQQHVTVNTIMQATWSYLVHRYTDSPDIVFGVTVSGRPAALPNIEQRAGMYINTVPLRAVLDESQPVSEWLSQFQEKQLATNEFQYASLSDIQQWSGINGTLFDNILVFENYPVGITSGNSTLQPANLRMNGQNNFPLSIIIAAGKQVNIHFRYNTDVLDATYVKNMRAHFGNVLHQLINRKQLNAISLMPDAQLNAINASQVEYPAHKTMVDIFNEQVMLRPEATALVFLDETLTYRQLNDKAEKLAFYLRLHGVKENSMVTISVKRSAECIIGILGILKAGAGYVPVNASFPVDRIAYILNDTQSSIFIADPTLKQNAHLFDQNILFIDLQSGWQLIEDAYIPGSPAIVVKPSSAMYVIYTSGSTGRPKGVVISHRALMDHAFGVVESAGLASCRSYALIASLIADAQHSMLYACFITGGTVHVIPEEFIADGEAMLDYITTNKIDCVKTVPSLWMAYAEMQCVLLPRQVLILGGETFATSIPAILLQAGYKGKIFNHYGPTETAIGKCIYEVNIHKQYLTVPIGKPFSNTQLYILDSRERLCPSGVPGELCIGGDGLADGYLNLPELTAEKFIADPYSTEPGRRLYRTGDVARWLPDGNIEHLGRGDDQVKINGHRIEIKEIESVLQEMSSISQAVVLVHEASSSRIVAYVVTSTDFDKDEAMRNARSKLPEYMVPDVLVQVEQIPLTSIGKIDRRKLASIDLPDMGDKDYQPPEDEIETVLVEIWQTILGKSRVGVLDDFFGSGGNSLLMMRMVSYIKKRLLLSVPVHALFRFTCIRELAKYITLQLHPAVNTDSTVDYKVLHI